MAQRFYFTAVLIVPGNPWNFGRAPVGWPVLGPILPVTSAAALVSPESCKQRNPPLDSRNWDVVIHSTEDST